MRVLSTKDRSAADVLRAVQSNPNVLGIVPADAVNARVRVLTVGGRHPLREPQRYPLHTPSTRPLPEITTITAVGDIMLGRRVGERHGADPGAPLKPLAKRLASAEITIGNFESILDRRITYPGWRLLRRQAASHPGTARGRIRSTFLGQQPRRRLRGPRLRQTLSRFSKSTIEIVGAGRNLAQARRPVTVERDGVRVGFVAVDSIGESPAATRNRAGTESIEHATANGSARSLPALRRISSDIRALSTRADVVIVMTHWGTQYTHHPEQSQRIAASLRSRRR